MWAESEGPGDDLRIELDGNTSIEVQVKKGLRSGSNLWDALLSLAKAINTGHLSHGILVVAPDSSKTICKDLATDIERLGQGRTDLLKNIGSEWAKKLAEANIPVTVCGRIRIRVIHALNIEDAHISAAKSQLHHICARTEDVDAAWNCLYRHAVRLIATRGRWTLPVVSEILCGG